MNGLFGFLGQLALTGSNVYQARLDNRLAITTAQAQAAATSARSQTMRYDLVAGAALLGVGFIIFKKFK